MAKISVLGAGSWGTALSVLLNNNGHEVRLWSRFQEEVDTLKQESLLPNFRGFIFRKTLILLQT